MNIINQAWLPNFHYSHDVKVIFHWTAGRYTPGDLELDHYHMAIDGQGKVHKGFRDLGTPAPHTYGYNHEIGIGICCMAGAHSRHRHGDYPMKRVQWEAAAEIGAQLCDRYGIKVEKTRVLTHAEVTTVLGLDQWGKWDIDELSFDPSITYPANDLRARIKDLLNGGKNPSRSDEVEDVVRNVVIEGHGFRHEVKGMLTNSSTYLQARDMERLGLFRIGKVVKGNGYLTARIKDTRPSAGYHHFNLMNLGGVGWFSVREFEKLGYRVTYHKANKSVMVYSVKGDEERANG